MSSTKTSTLSLLQVAAGQAEATVYISNARVVNVYSGEILDGYGIAIYQDRIAYVGKSDKMVGPRTQVIDAKGLFAVPGYIDAHGHADWVYNPVALARAVLPLGTTVILTETHDISNAMGTAGIDFMLDITEGLPLKYYFSLPAATVPYPELEGHEILPLDQIKPYLASNRVLALGELTAWSKITSLEEDAIEKVAAVRSAGKLAEGHMAGASPDKLNILAAAGFTSCHEAISAQEALERLRLGLYVMLRHGSIRRDLDVLADFLKNPEINTARVILTPDWLSPREVLRYGYMDYLVREAISYGIPPVKALQMATINPATYLHLDYDVGGIAPGRKADIQLVEDIQTPRASMVLADGQLIAKDGRLTVPVGGKEPMARGWRTGRVPDRPVEVKDLALPLPSWVDSSRGEVIVPAIQLASKSITRRVDVTLPVENGQLILPQSEDLLKVAMANRSNDGMITALLSGFGAKVGGMATSVSEDHMKPLVVGSRDEDMVVAWHRMLEIGGGVVIAEKGEVVIEVPLPWAGGLQSPLDLPQLSELLDKMDRYLQERGCTLEEPVVTLSFLTFAALPFVRLTPSGVFEVISRRIIFP